MPRFGEHELIDDPSPELVYLTRNEVNSFAMMGIILEAAHRKSQAEEVCDAMRQMASQPL